MAAKEVVDVRDKVKQLRALLEPLLQDSKAHQQWCTDSCLERYLRARNQDLRKAEKMQFDPVLVLRIRRSTYKPEEIRWEDIKGEARTGKLFITGHTDREGRTVILMRPSTPEVLAFWAVKGSIRSRCENTRNADTQIRNLVYHLEVASRQADARGVQKITWLIDFEGYGLRNAPPPKTGLSTLSILQNHYPERLGVAVCYHPPALFQITWKVCSPFIDPVTYRKIIFCEKGPKGDAALQQHFDLAHVEQSMGGTLPPLFDLDAYEQQQLALRCSAASRDGQCAGSADGTP